MTKDDKFRIGMALNKIAMMLSDEDFHKVKSELKRIEEIIAEQTEPQDVCPISIVFGCDECHRKDCTYKAEQTEPSDWKDEMWKEAVEQAEPQSSPKVPTKFPQSSDEPQTEVPEDCKGCPYGWESTYCGGCEWYKVESKRKAQQTDLVKDSPSLVEDLVEEQTDCPWK